MESNFQISVGTLLEITFSWPQDNTTVIQGLYIQN